MHESVDTSHDLLSDLGYEHRDVAFRKIALWLSILFGFLVFSGVVTMELFHFFTPAYVEAAKKVPAFKQQRDLPPHPQVQADPRRDLLHFHLADDASAEAIDEAKKAIASAGIAGVAQGAAKKETLSYPGSGAYEARPSRKPEGLE